MTAGTIFLMWLGEQIDEFGIGNGISLLIMAGILARMPGAGWQLLQSASLELSGCGQQARHRRLNRAGGHVRGGRYRRRVYHARAAADPDAKREARSRSTRFRRHEELHAAEGQSGGRHADHLRQQLADVPDDYLRQPGEFELARGLVGPNGPLSVRSLSVGITAISTIFAI